MTLDYLSVTDVSGFVSQHGAGAFRVSGVGAHPLDDNFNIAYAGWAMVVIFEQAGAAPRNITLFDGLERVVGSTVGISLTGFQVPNAGFDGKLAIVGLDGEANGAQLRFGNGRLTNANAISDALNPANRFFNGTRSYLGRAVTTVGDLPQTTGAANSLGGIDYDVVDVSTRLMAGQTSANAEVAAGSNDGIQSMIWVLAVSTFRPDLEDLQKSVRDINGGAFEEGDEVEYTIRVGNRGNDAAADVILSDVLPVGVEYVPSSLAITSSAANGILSDATGDDTGEYDGASRTVRVRLGMGATETVAGVMAPGTAATVRFRATVLAGTGGQIVHNQATVAARGAGGAPSAVTSSDSDRTTIGDQPTDLTVAARVETDAGVVADDATAEADAAPLADAAATVRDAGVVAPDARVAANDATAEPIEPVNNGCGCSGTRSPADAMSTVLLALAVLGVMRRARVR